jgi:hypothetical protein
MLLGAQWGTSLYWIWGYTGFRQRVSVQWCVQPGALWYYESPQNAEELGGWFISKAGEHRLRWWPMWNRKSHWPMQPFYVGIALPLWIPALMAALCAGLLVWLERRRLPPQCCQACGYDLTGNASGTCPECGSIVAPQRSDGQTDLPARTSARPDHSTI